MGKCIYCNVEISADSPVDVCRRCGIGVWGVKMFDTIVSNMGKETVKGNMELGRVGEDKRIDRITEIEKVMEISEELAEELEDLEEGQLEDPQDIVGQDLSRLGENELVIEEKNFPFGN